MPVLETRRPRPGLARSALTTGRTMRSEPLDRTPGMFSRTSPAARGARSSKSGRNPRGPPVGAGAQDDSWGAGDSSSAPQDAGPQPARNRPLSICKWSGRTPTQKPRGGQVDRLSRLCTGWKGPSLSRKASRGDRRNTDSEPSSALKWAPGLSAGPSAPSARGPRHQARAQPADPSPSLSCAAHARGPGGGAAQAQTHPDPHEGL